MQFRVRNGGVWIWDWVYRRRVSGLLCPTGVRWTKWPIWSQMHAGNRWWPKDLLMHTVVSSIISIHWLQEYWYQHFSKLTEAARILHRALWIGSAEVSIHILFFSFSVQWSPARWHLLLDTPVHAYPKDRSSFFSLTIYFLTPKVEQMHYRHVDMVPLTMWRGAHCPPQEGIAV